MATLKGATFLFEASIIMYVFGLFSIILYYYLLLSPASVVWFVGQCKIHQLGIFIRPFQRILVGQGEKTLDQMIFIGTSILPLSVSVTLSYSK